MTYIPNFIKKYPKNKFQGLFENYFMLLFFLLVLFGQSQQDLDKF